MNVFTEIDSWNLQICESKERFHSIKKFLSYDEVNSRILICFATFINDFNSSSKKIKTFIILKLFN